MQEKAKRFKQCSKHIFAVLFMCGLHDSVEHLTCSSECTCTCPGREAMAGPSHLSINTCYILK